MPRLLFLSVMLILAYVASTAASLDCRNATPLPDDIHLVPPASEGRI